MKEHYSIKDYLIRPIVTKINEEENTLRENIMAKIVATHKPYPVKEDENEEMIRCLEEKNILSIKDEEIVSIYPVSVEKTNKKVFFEDGSYAYAMCAIDAIGFHYAFRKPVIIEAECQHCGERIKIEVRDGKITVLEGPGDIHVLHTDLENNKDWSCSCCCIMHFFSCEDSLEKWLEQSCIDSKIYAVDLETANKIAWLLFSK